MANLSFSRYLSRGIGCIVPNYFAVARLKAKPARLRVEFFARHTDVQGCYERFLLSVVYGVSDSNSQTHCCDQADDCEGNTERDPDQDFHNFSTLDRLPHDLSVFTRLEPLASSTVAPYCTEVFIPDSVKSTISTSDRRSKTRLPFRTLPESTEAIALTYSKSNIASALRKSKTSA
jgi:hypothetical protein